MLNSRGELSARLIKLTSFMDKRGSLTVGEFPESLPFKVNRFFYVSQVPENEPRGIHAHKICHQLLICVSGSLKALIDDGVHQRTFALSNNAKGLYMPPLTWGSQYDFSSDAVLLVLTSHNYDADDYIHDYKEFLAVRAK